MIRIKLATGDTWSPESAADYRRDLEGGLWLSDANGKKVAEVAAGQWVYVEIPPES